MIQLAATGEPPKAVAKAFLSQQQRTLTAQPLLRVPVVVVSSLFALPLPPPRLVTALHTVQVRRISFKRAQGGAGSAGETQSPGRKVSIIKMPRRLSLLSLLLLVVCVTVLVAVRPTAAVALSPLAPPFDDKKFVFVVGAHHRCEPCRLAVDVAAAGASPSRP